MLVGFEGIVPLCTFLLLSNLSVRLYSAWAISASRANGSGNQQALASSSISSRKSAICVGCWGRACHREVLSKGSTSKSSRNPAVAHVYLAIRQATWHVLLPFGSTNSALLVLPKGSRWAFVNGRQFCIEVAQCSCS